MGTRAKLIPILRATRSMLSSSFSGNNAFMKVYPGSHRTKIDPRMYLAYTCGKAFSGITKTSNAVVEAMIMVIQYQ